MNIDRGKVQRNIRGKPGLSGNWNQFPCCNTVMGLVWFRWGEVGLISLFLLKHLPWYPLVCSPPEHSLFPFLLSCVLGYWNASQDLIIIHIKVFVSGIVSALLLSHLESWCLRRTQGKVRVVLGGDSRQPWTTQWWGDSEFRILPKMSCWHPCLLYSSPALLERS